MSFPVSLTREDMQAFDMLDLLPLRQSVIGARPAALALAAQGHIDGLVRPERFRILRHGPGGQILARNGLALAEAQLLLRQVCGPSVSFGPPIAHTVVDHTTGGVLAPTMLLRITAPRAWRRELEQLLEALGAEDCVLAIERNRVVLRAELPLSSAVGVERQVLDRTDSSAQVTCRLLRYSAAPAQALRQ